MSRHALAEFSGWVSLSGVFAFPAAFPAAGIFEVAGVCLAGVFFFFVP